MSNIMALVGALPFFWPIPQIIAYFMAKDNKLAKFYAIQTTLLVVSAIIVTIAFMIITMIVVTMAVIVLGDIGAFIGMIISLIMMFVYLIYFLVLFYQMYKAYMDQKFLIPLIGGLADKYSK